MVDKTSATTVIEGNQKVWGLDRYPAGCPNCECTFLVKPDQIGTICPFCWSEKLTPQPVRIRPGEPEKWLPFKIQRDRLPAIFQEFISGVWIKPDDFTVETLLARSVPVLWPLWLVDASVTGHWQIEAGFDYQVESTKENYQNGQWISRKQIEGRVRWEPRLGQISTRLNNIPAPALEAHHNRMQITGNYTINEMEDFDPQALGDCLVETPDLPPEEAWPLAKPQIDRSAAEICQRATGAQHHQNFAIKADYLDRHWTQFLLPLYATHYFDDEGEPQVLIVNGQTGHIQGPRLASRKRGLMIAGIIAGVAGLLFLLALIGLLLTTVFPPAGIIAAILGILGIGVGIGAIIPAVWPATWNNKQKDQPRLVQKRESA